MNKVIISVTFFLVITASTVYSANGFFNSERKLKKLPFNKIDVGSMACGNYFVYGQTGQDTPSKIGFIFDPESSDPDEVAFSGLFLPENVEIKIDSSKKVPTAEIVMPFPDLVFKKVIIKISEKDYKKSKCLPKPGKLPEKLPDSIKKL